MKFTTRILVPILFAAASSQGAIITYNSVLSGANESPAVVTAGTGLTTVSYDSILHTLTVSVSFSGLSGITTAAHVHCCIPPGGNAGVATLLPAFPGFPLGVTSGTLTNSVLDLTLASSWNPAFITSNGGTAASAEAVFGAGFIAGQTYLNIHTNVNPGGEIRALLVTASVPEPTTWTLLGGSLLALAARKRLRR
jgi:hypothetical protein